MRSFRSNPSSVAPPVGTYSHAAVVEAGEVRWLFVSGQLALDADGELVGAGDMAAQTEQVSRTWSTSSRRTVRPSRTWSRSRPS